MLCYNSIGIKILHRYFGIEGDMMPKKILLVEDEKHIARFVELELQHEGYEVKLPLMVEKDWLWQHRKILMYFYWM